MDRDGDQPSGSGGAMFPLLAMLAILTVSSMSVFTVSVLAPDVAPALGLAPNLIGVYVAIVYLFAMLTGTATGPLIQSLGAIRVCQVAMLLNAAGLALLALASLAAAVASAVCLGLAYGPFNPASAHILAGVGSARWRPLLFSIKQTGVPLGGALAGVLVPWLALAQGWQQAGLWVATGSLLVACLVQPLRRRFDVRLSPARFSMQAGLVGPIRLAMGDTGRRRYTLGAFCLAGCQVSVGGFMVVFLTGHVDLGLVQAGAVFACMQAGAFAGRLAWGVVAGARSPRSVLVLIAAIMAGCLATVLAMGPDWPLALVIAVAVALGLSSFGWNGVMLAEVARRAPPGRASEVTGGMQFVMFAGVVVWPPLFAAGVELTGGYGLPFAALVALALVAGTLIFTVPDERSPNPGSRRDGCPPVR